MKIPKLTIGSITAEAPIVQGGMGVRISLSSLASAVANQGGIGTISSIGLGDIENSKRDYSQESRDALISEIRKAKTMTDGHLAVNIMGVLSNADDLIKASVEEGIKMIVFGAGIPAKLPDIVQDRTVNLVPIVSSARVADLILRTWDKRYGVVPDGFILEGPLAGGHLGFSEEQLNEAEHYSLELLLPELLAVNKPYEDKYGQKIPVIAAGGIYDGRDIAKMLDLGASGVQMATRFVCTDECDASTEFKQAYLAAKEEDIVVIQSPVGLPGRAIKNKFLEDLERNGSGRIKCPYHCLTACKVDTAKYCIALALLNSYFGKVDTGLIFSGKNSYRIKEIIPVKALFDELYNDLRSA